MALNFFDTSALAKQYHAEIGTPMVDGLLAVPGDRHVISRLSVIEFRSAFAKQVRMGRVSLADYRKVTRRFRGDVAAKRIQVVRAMVAHYQMAERLIRKVGPSQNLRTLDALQLATALVVHGKVGPMQFVCADHALCGIAAAEGLMVLNPEIP